MKPLLSLSFYNLNSQSFTQRVLSVIAAKLNSCIHGCAKIFAVFCFDHL